MTQLRSHRQAPVPGSAFAQSHVDTASRWQAIFGSTSEPPTPRFRASSALLLSQDIAGTDPVASTPEAPERRASAVRVSLSRDAPLFRIANTSLERVGQGNIAGR